MGIRLLCDARCLLAEIFLGISFRLGVETGYFPVLAAGMGWSGHGDVAFRVQSGLTIVKNDGCFPRMGASLGDLSCEAVVLSFSGRRDLPFSTLLAQGFPF